MSDVNLARVSKRKENFKDEAQGIKSLLESEGKKSRRQQYAAEEQIIINHICKSGERREEHIPESGRKIYITKSARDGLTGNIYPADGRAGFGNVERV